MYITCLKIKFDIFTSSDASLNEMENVGEVDQLGDCIIRKELQNPAEEITIPGIWEFQTSLRMGKITPLQITKITPLNFTFRIFFAQRLSIFVKEVY